MQVRNFSVVTQAFYTREVSGFAQHFNSHQKFVGTEQIRAYQIYLTNERRWGSFDQSGHLRGCALPL